MTPDPPAPIFVLGVARSGTTLLRMMLDSHPAIMCGPESPWIAGRGAGREPNLRQVVEYLVSHKWGAVSGFRDLVEEDIYQATAEWLDRIMTTAAGRQGKSRWAEKTPTNTVAVPFLGRLFPRGRYIHLVRDGRDVALSTASASWSKLSFEGTEVRNSYANALRRWCEWNDTCRRDLEDADLDRIVVRYEDLLDDPEAELRRALDFVGVEWSPRVLHPYRQDHDVIDRAGEGMRSFFQKDGVDAGAARRWPEELGWLGRTITRRIADPDLVSWGYEPTP